MAAAASAVVAKGPGADRQALGAGDDAIMIPIEPVEHPVQRALQFDEGDAIVMIAIDLERAGKGVLIAQLPCRPFAIGDIPNGAGMRGIGDREAARDAAVQFIARHPGIAVRVTGGDHHRDGFSHDRLVRGLRQVTCGLKKGERGQDHRSRSGSNRLASP